MKEVFAVIGKMPLLGFSKTRLAKDIGENQALALYHAMIKDFLAGLKQYLNNDICLYLYITPDTPESFLFFQERLKASSIENYKILFQPELPFFNRLSYLFKEINKSEGESFVHLTGTDILDFPFSFLKQADTFENNSVSIGPDRDGGYYYIGTISKNDSIFAIEGLLDGTTSVFDATLRNINRHHLKVQIFPMWSDIDNIEDAHFCW